MGWIEVQRGQGKRLGSQGDDGMGKYCNSAPYKLEPKVVVGRSKLLLFFFFSFPFGWVNLFI